MMENASRSPDRSEGALLVIAACAVSAIVLLATLVVVLHMVFSDGGTSEATTPSLEERIERLEQAVEQIDRDLAGLEEALEGKP